MSQGPLSGVWLYWAVSAQVEVTGELGNGAVRGFWPLGGRDSHRVLNGITRYRSAYGGGGPTAPGTGLNPSRRRDGPQLL